MTSNKAQRLSPAQPEPKSGEQSDRPWLKLKNPQKPTKETKEDPLSKQGYSAWGNSSSLTSLSSVSSSLFAALCLCVKWLLFSLVALSAQSAEPPKAPVPKSPYIAVVYRYADTMLEKGRDTYGPQATGLFLSALDRATLAPLTNRPAAPAGVRESDRVGAPDGPLVGANPQHDENLLRLLYLLSELTTKPKYRDAANDALKWFLQNARSSATDLLPWGEHMSWDVASDKFIAANGNENG